MINVELGHISAHLGLDENGKQIYSIHTEGDITYIQALGLLTAAQRDLPDIYEQETWGDDE